MKSKKSKQQQNSYEIKKIICFGWLDGRKFFKIWWKGYTESEATWEPMINLAQWSSVFNQYFDSLDPKEQLMNLTEILNKEEIADIRQSMKAIVQKVTSESVKSQKHDFSEPDEKVKSAHPVSSVSSQLRKQAALNNSGFSDPLSCAVSEKAMLRISDPLGLKRWPINLQVRDVITGMRTEDGTIELFVSWQPDDDGYQRPDEFVEKTVVMKRWPARLMEFYESKVRWV